jgi:hypothetical protein
VGRKTAPKSDRGAREKEKERNIAERNNEKKIKNG